MRSRITTLLACGLVAFASCEGQPERIEEICDSVANCSGFDIKDCQRRLEAAVDDHRLSQPGLARCASCLDHNASANECADVLVARDCDKACEETQLVLNARTSAADRLTACTTFVGNCSDVLGNSEDCAAELRSVLQDDPTLNADLRIGACLDCIEPFKVPVHAAGGASGAGGEGAQVPQVILSLNECSTILERCAMACDNVTAIERRFDLTQAALGVCRRGVRNCIRSLDTTPGSGGAGGTGGDGSGADMPLPPQPLDECYLELLQENADDVQKCSACEAANPVCEDLAANCSECLALYPTPAVVK